MVAKSYFQYKIPLNLAGFKKVYIIRQWLNLSLSLHSSNIDKKPWYLPPTLIGVSCKSFSKIEGIEPTN